MTTRLVTSQPAMVTIHDVAVHAGVSATTVSHVINGTRRVSPLLAERVRAAMDELGYQPNALARSLRRKQSHTIGLVVPDNSNPYFADMARGIEEVAFRSSHTLVLGNSAGDSEREALYLDMLLRRQVDGIILVLSGGSSEAVRPLALRGLPVVVVDREMPGAALDCVFTDNVAGGFEATAHLLRLGHRRIGCITGPHRVTSSAGRVEGYEKALRAAGVRPDSALVVQGDFTSPSGQLGLSQMMRLKSPPSAVFACNDVMAIGAMAAARDMGLAVPGDLSIVGYDNIHFAALLNPPLTTVAQPTYELGRIAATLLIERMGDRSLPPRRVLLANELIVRATTAPPATLLA